MDDLKDSDKAFVVGGVEKMVGLEIALHIPAPRQRYTRSPSAAPQIDDPLGEEQRHVEIFNRAMNRSNQRIPATTQILDRKTTLWLIRQAKRDFMEALLAELDAPPWLIEKWLKHQTRPLGVSVWP